MENKGLIDEKAGSDFLKVAFTGKISMDHSEMKISTSDIGS